MPALRSDTETLKLKTLIITLFNKRVRGRKPDTSSSNQKHDGKQGHWLETQMGVARNRRTAPDLHGFEMKNQTGSKTTFGDWSPDYKIYSDPAVGISRDDFLRMFGKPNPEKEMRFSWSGSPCPKISAYNTFGQILEVQHDGSILALYSYAKDTRSDKSSIIPAALRKNNVVLAKWSADIMRKRVEKKFNTRGWFQCRRNEEGIYSEIVFGSPISFDEWIADVKRGRIYFDSGMYQGNKRPYSQWRADNIYWDNLVTSRH